MSDVYVRLQHGSWYDEEEIESDSGNNETPTADFKTTVFNICNNVVGSGLLTLPWCLKEASIMEAIAMLIIIGILSALSMILLAICCEVTQCFTFKGLGEITMGRTFGAFMQWCLFFYAFLSCVSFIILAADFISGESGIAQGFCDKDSCDTFLFHLFNARESCIMVITLFILLPVSFIRNLSSLNFVSIVSIVGMFYVLFLVIYFYVNPPEGAKEARGELRVWDLRWGVFTAAPVVNVAYVAHYNSPRFYFELKDRSIKKYSKAVGLSFVVCMIVYLGVATFGYLTFGEALKSNILKNIDSHNKFAVVGRIAMTGVVLGTYPLTFNSMRSSALTLLETHMPLRDFTTPSVYSTVTVVLVSATFLFGSLWNNIGIVLDYKGAILGGLIGFAFGGLIFLAAISPGSIPQWCLSSRVDADPLEEDFVNIRRYSSLNMTLLSGRQFMQWKTIAIALILWCPISGILGVVVTTIKLYK